MTLPLGRHSVPLVTAVGTLVILIAVLGVQPVSAQSDPASCAAAVADAVNNPGLVSDCEALLDVRDLLTGSGDPLNWSASTLITEWAGVSVSGTPGRVTKLDLHKMRLRGSIPSDLSRVTALTDLYLQDNHLAGSIPPELGSLTGLVRLYADDNDLAGEVPSELGGLLALRELRLSSNNLTGSLPAALGNLASLTILDLSDNDLSGPIPPQVGSMSRLDWLNVNQNNLSGQLPQELGNLSRLRRLYVSENDLSGPIPGTFGRLSRLTHIVAQSNDLSGEIPAELADLSSLVWMGLYDNDLTGEIPAELGGLVNLQRLYLSGNDLTGPIPPGLGEATALTNLWLDNNSLSGVIPTELDRLTNLVRWRLRGNDFIGCVPAGLAVVRSTDIDQLGLGICTSELASISASPTSQTQIEVSWTLGIDDVTALSLYRDGELLATPSVGILAYEDIGLSPNTRYRYQIVARGQDGAYAGDGVAVATLAYRPKTSDQMATTWTGLQQPIVDELNPDGTEYRITLTRDDGHTSVSDWGTSKCRTFDDLEPSSFYRISVIVRNLDGIETAPADQRAGEYGRDVNFFPPNVFTRRHPGTDDPWVVDRINDSALIFGLTDAAVEWMNNDILIEWMRGEPGSAGHLWGRAGIGHSFLGTLMHETMHAFWQFWDGFPEPCDQMSFYTFRRDVAQFVLDFRDYDQSGAENPLEPWRIFYNVVVGLMSGEQGEDFWSALERGEYGKFLGVYHQMETSFPAYAPRHLSLIPPTLRKYLRGFMEEGERRTWDEEMDWYTRLAGADQDLWGPFLSHEIAHHSPGSHAPPTAARTTIPEPLRSSLREIDRRKLVDFINTLEDQVPWEWRDGSPGFWSFYVRHHIYRIGQYGGELDSSIGIELEEAHLDAVIEALQALNSLHCAPGHRGCGYNPGYRRTQDAERVRELITNLQNISDIQRRVLLEMVDMPEDVGINALGAGISGCGFEHPCTVVEHVRGLRP